MEILHCKDFNINYEFINVIFQRYCRYNCTDIDKIVEKSCSNDNRRLKELVINDLRLYDNYVKKLLTIIVNNKIEIQPLSLEEVISISSVAPLINVIASYLSESCNENSLFMSVSYDDILLYNLIKSIKLNDSSLLNSIKYNNSENLDSLIVFNNDKDYLKLLKAIKECKPETITSNTKKIYERDTRIFDIFVDKLSNVLSNVLYENNVYGDGFILYMKRFFMSKLTMMCMFAFGRFLEVLISESSVKGNTRKIELKIIKYAYFLIDELLKAMHNEIFSNSTIENNILDGYTEYIMYYLETLKMDTDKKDEDVDNFYKVENESACKELKIKIKKLRRKIYNLRQEMKMYSADNKYNTVNHELNNKANPSNTGLEELSNTNSNQSLSLVDKLKLLNEAKVVIVTSLNIFDKYTEIIDVIDANQFKGKSINSKYKYVVKLTCGINHHIGYDINSEAMKINAKIITCSRTNINLIVDAVLKEL